MIRLRSALTYSDALLGLLAVALTLPDYADH